MTFGSDTSGVYMIAPTPFDEEGRVDFASIDRLCAHYEEAGVQGITVLGVLGEAPKLDPAEAVAVAKHFLRSSSLPIIVGVSAPGFAQMASLSRAVMDSGAAGVMIGPPPHLRTDDQIVGYFAQAAAAVASAPWVLQDYPLALGVQMSVNVVGRIVNDNSNCMMLKHEDWPGLDKITALRRLEAEGKLRHVSILCGNNGMFLDFETERGADGAMTGYAFPEMLVDLVKLAREGQREKLHDLFDRHLPLIRYDHQPGVGLGVRKHIFKRRGIFSSDAQRGPRSLLSAATRDEIDYLVGRIARHEPRYAMKVT